MDRYFCFVSKCLRFLLRITMSLSSLQLKISVASIRFAKIFSSQFECAVEQITEGIIFVFTVLLFLLWVNLLSIQELTFIWNLYGGARGVIWRCPWCNCYRRRIWTRRHEFKSWTWLIAFHIALIPLGKVWIQLFSLQLWVNSRAD